MPDPQFDADERTEDVPRRGSDRESVVGSCVDHVLSADSPPRSDRDLGDGAGVRDIGEKLDRAGDGHGR